MNKEIKTDVKMDRFLSLTPLSSHNGYTDREGGIQKCIWWEWREKQGKGGGEEDTAERSTKKRQKVN